MKCIVIAAAVALAGGMMAQKGQEVKAEDFGRVAELDADGNAVLDKDGNVVLAGADVPAFVAYLEAGVVALTDDEGKVLTFLDAEGELNDFDRHAAAVAFATPAAVAVPVAPAPVKGAKGALSAPPVAVPPVVAGDPPSGEPGAGVTAPVLAG